MNYKHLWYFRLQNNDHQRQKKNKHQEERDNKGHQGPEDDLSVRDDGSRLEDQCPSSPSLLDPAFKYYV